MDFSKKLGLFIGPLLFLTLSNLPFEMVSEKGDAVIAVAVWMIVWWISEAVSISVTALLPLFLLPLLKVMPIADVGAKYGSPIVFLFFGGFVLALALEKVNLHKRIALNIIRLTGTTPNKVVLGFMIATASLSMWISNTATAVVMLPIAMSVIGLLVNDADGFTKSDRNFALSVMLGIAFSANAGGIATVIGTPPNSVLIGLLENQYHIEISFLKWMVIGLPFSVIMVGISYVVLVKWMFPNKHLQFAASKEVINDELRKLGAMGGKEKMVLAIFGVTVFLWIFRTVINNILPDLKLNDTIISMIAAVAMFSIPYNLKKGDFLIHWRDTQKTGLGHLDLIWRWVGTGGGHVGKRNCRSGGQCHSRKRNIDHIHGRPIDFPDALYDRTDEQCGPGRCTCPSGGGYCHRTGDSGTVSADTGNHGEQLCFYVAHGHPAERHCFRERIYQGTPNGPGRYYPEPYRGGPVGVDVPICATPLVLVQTIKPLYP